MLNAEEAHYGVVWYFDKAALVSAGLGLLICLYVRRKQGINHRQLGYLLESVLAGFTIPKGLYLIYCAIDRSGLTALASTAEYSVYLGVAGFCVAYLAAIWLKHVYTVSHSSDADSSGSFPPASPHQPNKESATGG